MKTRIEKRWLCAMLSMVLLLACIPATPVQAAPMTMKLTQNKEALTVARDTLLDLNGYTVNQLNVKSGTVLVKDSKTDDYTVADNDYGKIVSTTIGDTGAVEAQEGYMKVEEDAGTSYHKVDLTITAMSLRAKEVGVYYKSAFKGDEKVAENVKSYGIALSISNVPTADGSKHCAYSKYTKFVPGPEGNSGNGTLLSGVMKPENPDEENQKNAEHQIYGRSYLKTKSGEYIYGNCVQRSLKEQLEAVAGAWMTYSAAARSAVLDLCEAYQDVVSTWDNLPDLFWQLKETVVSKPMTAEELDNIPVANSSMTENQLRQICIDFMRLQMTFNWTPSETVTYKRGDYTEEIKAGALYKGMAYKGSGEGGNGHGNIYTVLERYSQNNGMLDVSWENGMVPFTNQCSSSTYWAWSRVVTSADYQYTSAATPANGYLPVGNLKYPEGWPADLKEYTEEFNTRAICQQYENDKATFYANSYALMKPGDGLLYFNGTAGHARMVVSVALKDSNNNDWKEGKSISGLYSYVTVLEQDGVWNANSDETVFVANGGTERNIEFYRLFASGYIPFTFAEFRNPSKVEVATATTSQTKNTMTKNEFKALQVSSNYAISNITFVIKKANGMVAYREFVPAYMWGIQNSVTLFGLKGSVRDSQTGKYKTILNIEDFSEYFDGNHTIEISAQLGSGEKPVVYTGTLVAG